MVDSSRTNAVLIAVDGSTFSQDAFTWYIENCYLDAHTLIVAHCIQPPVVYELADQRAYDNQIKELHRLSQKLEQSYADLFKSRGIQGKFLTAFEQYPETWISEVAEREKVQLVILGTRGFGTLRRTVLGSVSEYVIQHANCAVAVCHLPEQARRESHAEDFFK